MGERVPIEPDLWKRLTAEERLRLLDALRPGTDGESPRGAEKAKPRARKPAR